MDYCGCFVIGGLGLVFVLFAVGATTAGAVRRHCRF